jgi:hypothetical protein
VNFRDGGVGYAALFVYLEPAALFFVIGISPEPGKEIESEPEGHGTHQHDEDDLNGC